MPATTAYRLAWLLADLPVTIICRVRSDRVYYAPAGARRGPTKARAPRHGAKLVLRDPATHPAPTVATINTERYGRAEATAFAKMHPKIDARSGFARPPGPGTDHRRHHHRAQRRTAPR